MSKHSLPVGSLEWFHKVFLHLGIPHPKPERGSSLWDTHMCSDCKILRQRRLQLHSTSNRREVSLKEEMMRHCSAPRQYYRCQTLRSSIFPIWMVHWSTLAKELAERGSLKMINHSTWQMRCHKVFEKTTFSRSKAGSGLSLSQQDSYS